MYLQFYFKDFFLIIRSLTPHTKYLLNTTSHCLNSLSDSSNTNAKIEALYLP